MKYARIKGYSPLIGDGMIVNVEVGKPNQLTKAIDTLIAFSKKDWVVDIDFFNNNDSRSFDMYDPKRAIDLVEVFFL